MKAHYVPFVHVHGSRVSARKGALVHDARARPPPAYARWGHSRTVHVHKSRNESGQHGLMSRRDEQRRNRDPKVSRCVIVSLSRPTVRVCPTRADARTRARG